jgi:hypothetical protein
MLANYGGTADSEEQQTIDPRVDKKRKKDDAAATKVSLSLHTFYTERFPRSTQPWLWQEGTGWLCNVLHYLAHTSKQSHLILLPRG